MAKKRGFFKNYYNVIRLSRWVSSIRIAFVILFLLTDLIFEWQILNFNVYFTILLALYLFENSVFALASVPEKIFDNNKIRHLLLASKPVSLLLTTFIMFWPITVALIILPVGNLLKIILAFVFAKLIVSSAVGVSNHYESKIIVAKE